MAEHSAEMAAKVAPLVRAAWSSCSTQEWLSKLQGAQQAAGLAGACSRRAGAFVAS